MASRNNQIPSNNSLSPFSYTHYSPNDNENLKHSRILQGMSQNIALNPSQVLVNPQNSVFEKNQSLYQNEKQVSIKNTYDETSQTRRVKNPQTLSQDEQRLDMENMQAEWKKWCQSLHSDPLKVDQRKLCLFLENHLNLGISCGKLNIVGYRLFLKGIPQYEIYNRYTRAIASLIQARELQAICPNVNRGKNLNSVGNYLTDDEIRQIKRNVFSSSNMYLWKLKKFTMLILSRAISRDVVSLADLRLADVISMPRLPQLHGTHHRNLVLGIDALEKSQKEFVSILRHKDVDICPVSHLARYFFTLWCYKGTKNHPSFQNVKNWYKTRVFPFSPEIQVENTLREQVKEMVFSLKNMPGASGNSRTDHTNNEGSVTGLHLPILSKEYIEIYGHWNQDELEKFYHSSLPWSAMMRNAGFHTNDQYELPRDPLTPPLKLQQMVFTFIEEESKVQINKSDRHMAAVKFLELLKYLRIVLFQDAAILISRKDSSPLWEDPVFSSIEFKEFQKQVLENMRHYNSISVTNCDRQSNLSMNNSDRRQVFIQPNKPGGNTEPLNLIQNEIDNNRKIEIVNVNRFAATHDNQSMKRNFPLADTSEHEQAGSCEVSQISQLTKTNPISKKPKMNFEKENLSQNLDMRKEIAACYNNHSTHFSNTQTFQASILPSRDMSNLADMMTSKLKSATQQMQPKQIDHHKKPHLPTVNVFSNKPSEHAVLCSSPMNHDFPKSNVEKHISLIESQKVHLKVDNSHRADKTQIFVQARESQSQASSDKHGVLSYSPLHSHSNAWYSRNIETLDTDLTFYDIWKEWFQGRKGIGPLMEIYPYYQEKNGDQISQNFHRKKIIVTNVQSISKKYGVDEVEALGKCENKRCALKLSWKSIADRPLEFFSNIAF